MRITVKNAMPEYDYDNEPDFDEWDDDNCGDCGECEYCWEEQLQECGLTPDGSCNLAGTEHCDFECRIRDLDDDYGAL